MEPFVRRALLVVPIALVAACTVQKDAPPAASSGAAPAPGAPAVPAKVWFEGSYEDGLAQARATSKLVFIDFNTTWCTPCRKLEKETFSKPEVQAVLSKMVSMSIDAESKAGLPLSQKFHISGYPEMLVLDSSGKELGRISGFQPPEKFLARMETIRARANR